VTGGASGIGYEIALQLGLHGAKVRRIMMCPLLVHPAVDSPVVTI